MRTKKQSTPTAESVLLRIADEIDPNTSVIPSKTYSEIAAELRDDKVERIRFRAL